MFTNVATNSDSTSIQKPYSASESENRWSKVATGDGTIRGYLNGTFLTNLKVGLGNVSPTNVQKITNSGCKATSAGQEITTSTETVFIPSIANIFTYNGILLNKDGDQSQWKTAVSKEEPNGSSKTMQYSYFRDTLKIGDRDWHYYEGTTRKTPNYADLKFTPVGSTTAAWYALRSPFGAFYYKNAYWLFQFDGDQQYINGDICTRSRGFIPQFCL